MQHFLTYGILGGVVFLFLSGCSSEKVLPESHGAPSAVVAVANPQVWEGAAGVAVKRLLRTPYPGLPQEEPSFDVNTMSPLHLGEGIQRFRALLFVIVLDDRSPAGRRMTEYVGDDIQKKVQEAGRPFVYIEENKFARDQWVAFLVAPDQATLIAWVSEQQAHLLALFHQEENQLLQKKLRRSANTSLMETVFGEKPYQLLIPGDMRVELQQPDFVWLRHPDTVEDENILVFARPFTGHIDDLTVADMQALRDSLSRQYLYGDPEDTASYMTAQPDVAVTANRLTDFNGLPAIEYRGLWKLNNRARGGPYISYMVADEQAGMHYYIEGFVAAPAAKKRNFTRRVQAILSTFRLKD